MQRLFMRKLATALILGSILAISCKKEKATEDNSAACVSGGLDPTEQLNTEYGIGFPAWYKDGGYIVYQGDFFTKHYYGPNDTVSVVAKYTNKNNTNNSVWGEALTSVDAPTIDITYKEKLVTLKLKKKICSNGGIGYYYYTLGNTADNNGGLGIVYLKQGEVYRQSIIVSFTPTKESEINSIIASISKR